MALNNPELEMYAVMESGHPNSIKYIEAKDTISAMDLYMRFKYSKGCYPTLIAWELKNMVVWQVE